LELKIHDQNLFISDYVFCRWENPLMGWTSTGDPYAHVGDSALGFDSEEAAKAFAERHGWEYVVCVYPFISLLKSSNKA
jgi:hypothetical protein